MFKLSYRDSLFVTAGIFYKIVLEFLRHKPALIIIRPGITSVFIFMDTRDMVAEKGIWDETVESRIADIWVDDQLGDDGEEDIIAQTVETAVGIKSLGDAVRITVEEGTMLLKHLRWSQ